MKVIVKPVLFLSVFFVSRCHLSQLNENCMSHPGLNFKDQGHNEGHFEGHHEKKLGISQH